MNTAEAWRVAAHQAAIRRQDLIQHIVTAPHGRVAWGEFDCLAGAVSRLPAALLVHSDLA